jgi:hypothetical protein
VWWLRPLISVLGKLRQEDGEFKANLDDISEFASNMGHKTCLKKKKKKRK